MSYATWQQLAHPKNWRVVRRTENTFGYPNHRYSCELRMRHKDGYWVGTF
ncbi:hypothetical protein [Chromatium okenii]|nr:hypothetical protein [Chromatium okenii]